MTTAATLDDPRFRRDLLITALSLAAVVGWDVAGLDLAVSRWFGDARGFGARDGWWADVLLHAGGRWAAWATAAALLVVALRAPKEPPSGPGRSERLRWLAAVLACALAVPLLKRLSATSCPWDLAEFGGLATHVSHWDIALLDGGPGHCFPAGHPVAAFAFLGMAFLWRRHDPARARRWLVGTLGAGALFGLVQLVRGAHFASHVLWSGWICWLVCVCAETAMRWRRARVRSAFARSHPPSDRRLQPNWVGSGPSPLTHGPGITP